MKTFQLCRHAQRRLRVRGCVCDEWTYVWNTHFSQQRREVGHPL